MNLREVQEEEPEDSDAFAFDSLTGMYTYYGYELFLLNVQTGALTPSPAAEIAQKLKASSTRSSLSRTFVVYAHYDWPPLGSGPVLEQGITMDFQESTCWPSQTLSFSARQEIVNKTDHTSCRSYCRAKADCTHYKLLGQK